VLCEVGGFAVRGEHEGAVLAGGMLDLLHFVRGFQREGGWGVECFF